MNKDKNCEWHFGVYSDNESGVSENNSKRMHQWSFDLEEDNKSGFIHSSTEK
jgi:hypothetical protein